MLPVLLITLVAFVSQVSPNDINVNVDEKKSDEQGCLNCDNIQPYGTNSGSRRCLWGDTGLVVDETDVAELYKYAVPDPPYCSGDDDPIYDFLAHLTSDLRDNITNGGLDPLPLPSATVSFSKKMWPITFHGDALAYNGYLRGLATIDFCGHLTRDDENQVNGIKLSASFKEVKGYYDLHAIYMFLGVTADMTFQDENPILSISASLDSEKCRFQITDLDIDIRHMSATVCGLGHLDWTLDILVDLLSGNIESFIQDQKNLLIGKVNAALDTVDMTIMKYVIDCATPPDSAPSQI